MFSQPGNSSRTLTADKDSPQGAGSCQATDPRQACRTTADHASPSCLAPRQALPRRQFFKVIIMLLLQRGRPSADTNLPNQTVRPFNFRMSPVNGTDFAATKVCHLTATTCNR